MSLTMSLMLPLAAMTMADDRLVSAADGGSARFADVLVTAYVCEHLGFGVNYEGLANWGETIGERMAADAAIPSEQALARIRDDVVSARERFNAIHGPAVWASAMTLTGIDAGSDAQYRFQKSFTGRCNDLVAAADTGAFFAAPEGRLSGAGLSRKTRAMFLSARGGA